jgi:hypothetical protein
VSDRRTPRSERMAAYNRATSVLPVPMELNKAYFINLEDEFDGKKILAKINDYNIDGLKTNYDKGIRAF